MARSRATTGDPRPAQHLPRRWRRAPETLRTGAGDMTLNELDTAPPDEAARALAACCGSSRWVGSMVSRRPFASIDALLRAADESWWSLTSSDWLEAFSHHPRIGE